MLAAWCLTAWKVPIVLPNCSRTFAYSTAISRLAQLTPTASADARIRNTVRACRAAPAQHPVVGHGDAAQRNRTDAARGVKGLKCSDRNAIGVGVDDHHIVTRGEHQHVRVGRAENRGTLPGNHQVRTDDDAAGQSERAHRGAVGEPRK